MIKENGAERPSLLADAFEAVVAALYLETRLRRGEVLRPRRARATRSKRPRVAPGEVDPKTRLRQWAEANGRGTPGLRRHLRRSLATTSPSCATVLRRRPVVASGEGRSKKSAEANAAQGALGGRSSMPELAEVETVRVSLSRDLIGKKIKTALGHQRARRSAPQDGQGLSRAGRRALDQSVQRLGKNLVIGARQLDAPRHPPRHERSAAARQGSQGPQAQAHPRRLHLSSRAASCATSTREPSASSTSRSRPAEGEPPAEISKFARLSIGGRRPGAAQGRARAGAPRP